MQLLRHHSSASLSLLEEFLQKNDRGGLATCVAVQTQITLQPATQVQGQFKFQDYDRVSEVNNSFASVIT